MKELEKAEAVKANKSLRDGGATDKVVSHLLAEIENGKIKPGDKLPSRTRLAQNFSVSLPTVTEAYRRLSENDLVTHVPGKGVYLAGENKQRTYPMTIGVVGMFASRSGLAVMEQKGYWAGLLSSLTLHAHEKDYGVLLVPGTAKEPLDLNRVRAYRPAAVISIGIQLSAETVIEFRRRGIPLLLGNRHLENLGVSYVDYDNADTFRRVVRLFYERGHRHIAALVTAASVPAVQERYRNCFYMELAACGCSYRYNDYWRVLPSDGGRAGLEELGHDTTLALLDMPKPPTAIYCRGPEMADGVASAAAERGLKIGRDMSIIMSATFGEEGPYSAFLAPHDELGKKMVMAVEKIVGDPHEICQIDVPTQLFQHNSWIKVLLLT